MTDNKLGIPSNIQKSIVNNFCNIVDDIVKHALPENRAAQHILKHVTDGFREVNSGKHLDVIHAVDIGETKRITEVTKKGIDI